MDAFWFWRGFRRGWLAGVLTAFVGCVLGAIAFVLTK